MKKNIYIILLAIASALAFASCTEDTITPKSNCSLDNASGGGTTTGKL